MKFKTIELDYRGPVVWLYLNRPEAMNAISITMQLEMRQAWNTLRKDRNVRVVVLSGRGRAFCAGADLKADAPEPGEDGAPAPEFIDVAEVTDAVLAAFPKPVIAALNGITCGGGLETAMMADLIVAKRSAKIGDAHTNFGMLPGGGATLRIPRMIGLMRARYLMYTGELRPAADMEAMGLVAKVFDDETFEADVQALAEKLAAKSPLALARMKKLINDGYDMPSAAALAAEKQVVRQPMKSADAAEGMAAFAEKRPPAFKGY